MFPFWFGAAAVAVAGVADSKVLATDDEFYTTRDASVLLEISEYTVRKKIREGEIKAETIPGKSGYRIRKSVLNEYMENKNKGKNKSATTAVNTTSDKTSDAIFVESMAQLGEMIANNPEVKNMNPELLRRIVEGKQMDLKGLKLRLQMLELDGDDSTEFKKKKLKLEIAINNLEAEIQAYKISELTLREMKNDSSTD